MDAQLVQHTAPILTRAIESIGDPEELRLLDAGSGYGALACFPGFDGRRRADVRLLDPNPALLPLAYQRLRAAGLSVQAHLGAIDGPALPLGLCGNDIVLMSFTATHLRHLEAAMANAAQAVRAGGLVVVVDVDYPASFTLGCPAAAEALAAVQRRLVQQDLVERLPRAAAIGGLVPHPDVDCLDRWQAYHGLREVRDGALGFIASFHPTDDAVPPWRRIGPDARLYLRRLSHVYLRPAQR